MYFIPSMSSFSKVLSVYLTSLCQSDFFLSGSIHPEYKFNLKSKTLGNPDFMSSSGSTNEISAAVYLLQSTGLCQPNKYTVLISNNILHRNVRKGISNG